MINTQEVNETLCAISGMSSQEVSSYSTIVNNSIGVVESALTDDSYAEDDRIVYLAAARAYYNITLAGNGDDNVESFSAGDVKVNYAKTSCERALEMYKNASNAAAGMVQDNGFVFRGV